MIAKLEDAFDMVCPMGLGSETGNRCYGEKCMAWRRFGPDEGYCGMCPVGPDEVSEEF